MLQRLIGEDIDLLFVPEHELGSVEADPGQIEQMLMNLAVNARDAMPQGGKLTIETESVVLDHEYARRHADVEPGPYVMLSVSDTGCGMDKATQERIFEPFFTTKERGRGTGMGLATVYGIAKQHGGSIRVYSELGEGTTFKVYLPRTDAQAQDLAAKGQQPAPVAGAETILVAEDDSSVREVAQRSLEAQGYTVICAASPSEAEAQFDKRGGEIALLLSDVVMPECSGKMLYDRLLAKRPSLKVLYMSGYTDDAIVHRGVLDEGTLFIHKPFDAGNLLKKVREALDQ